MYVKYVCMYVVGFPQQLQQVAILIAKLGD